MSRQTTTKSGGYVDADVIAGVFADVLGTASHPVDRSLTASGGTSLHAIRVAARLTKMTGTTVPAITVIKNPYPQALSQLLTEDSSDTVGAYHDANEHLAAAATASSSEQWPLPSPQRRIWALHERDPHRLDHFVTVSMELAGDHPAPTAFVDAWAAMIARHPTLRMRVEDGAIPQATGDGARGDLEVLDVSALPETVADGLIDEEVSRLRHQPIDLRTGPIARALWVSRREKPSTLDMVFHHIACDGTSLTLLLDEFFEAVAAASSGRSMKQIPVGLTYADFAQWEDRARSRWSDCLSRCERDLLPAPEPLDLPKLGPAQKAWEATDVILPMGATWTSRLQSAFVEHSYSPLVIGLTAVAITLSRTAKQDSFYVAVPVANRAPGFETVIGDFVNTSIVKMDMKDTWDVRELLERTASQVSRVYEAQDLPFEELTNHLRSQGAAPDEVVPRIAVTLYNIPSAKGSYRDGELTVIWRDVAERESKYDVVVTIDVIDDRLSITCDPNAFDGAAANAFLRRIERATDLILHELGV